MSSIVCPLLLCLIAGLRGSTGIEEEYERLDLGPSLPARPKKSEEIEAFVKTLFKEFDWVARRAFQEKMVEFYTQAGLKELLRIHQSPARTPEEVRVLMIEKVFKEYFKGESRMTFPREYVRGFLVAGVFDRFFEKRMRSQPESNQDVSGSGRGDL